METDDQDAAMMAAAIGFSSFGTQAPQQKKRRYNAAADAVADSSARLPSTQANSTPLGGANTAKDDDQKVESTSSQEILAHVEGLPSRPIAASSPAHSQRSSGGRPQQHHGPRELWYQGYYDNTSNENPWERLEKAAGLSSKGTWIPRQVQPLK